ncbi:LOW QUALITY PROTEIN: tudor domain-containing protein 3 [Drosophila gunungcola]|uniref:LOW QUALITY PROTEIN: tudor domain-containing protein 3 n=1 Tax=Drosophila gunungcola TaxID=103775 RepID=UPI0022E368AC|nr:LOW QUALITY PROTEIN: tudor domain-containing protein 3 [Drosophila gunungcola]
MELAKKLQEVGWHLTEEGLKVLTTAVGSEDTRKIIDEALNRDFRDIGGGALPTKREDATLPGKIVLQVQRVRNIAAPKANEESKAAPRLIQLDLSDGQNSIQALELEPVPQLNLNVAPGSKIFFKAEKLQLMQGFMLLRSTELQLLGGRVDALYEKWDLARTMLRYARSGRPLSGTSVPPPWVAFGRKIDTTAERERNFKSLGSSGDKDKPVKENDEFNAMRTEAIAVATKAGGKKVFGGGGQNIVDHNIKKILDKGFTEEEARSALHATRNNLERALFNLKRRKEAGGLAPIETMGRPGRGDRPPREGKRGASAKDEATSSKPAANATLFDFLTNKLPATETPAPSIVEAFAVAPAAPPTANHFNPFKQYGNSRFGEADSRSSALGGGGKFGDRSRFENNVSSSFAAHRGGHAGSSRGGGRNRGGGRDERPTRDERPPREDRPPREEKPPREERAPRERGGGGFNERAAGRNKPESAAVKTSNRNGPDNPIPKTNSEVKTEQETTNGKEHAGNRRGSDRGSNRGGSNRGENGNANGSRRKQQAVSSGSNSGSATAKPPNNSGEDFNARLSKVTEETANLKVSSAPKRENRRKQGQGQANRQAGAETESQQQQQSTQLPSQKPEKAQNSQKHQNQHHQQHHHNPRHHSHANYSQLANGYTYDPSKIMGFQSKEANEFAMSLLKSQGVTMPNHQQQQELPPTTFGPVSAPIHGNPYAPPAPVSAPQAAPREHFGMTPGDAWMWQKGDLCMAKYWDDGRYYEAEITGVSEKTCVVFFMGYGNHEEVLKADILPITDAQNRPLSNAPQQQQHQQQQQQSRYRGDRQAQQQQVYVPPHKREH